MQPGIKNKPSIAGFSHFRFALPLVNIIYIKNFGTIKVNKSREVYLWGVFIKKF